MLIYLNHSIFIGIDVAKHHHDAFILDNSTGEVIHSHFRFDNTLDGFDSLLEIVEHCPKDQLLFGMEATGHYHQALVNYLVSLGFSVGILNPLQTNRLREVNLRRVKTDSVDAKVIVQALILGYHQPFKQTDSDCNELKSLSRFRFRLVEQRSKCKVAIGNCLDLLFPEYQSFFKGTAIHSKTSYCLLKRYGSATQIANARIDGLTNILTKYRLDNWSVDKLKHLAKHSAGQHSDSLIIQLHMWIEQIELLTSQIVSTEKQLKLILDALDTPIMTIPGISHTLASVILGEIGSIERFSNSSKLLAFCGLNPTIHQSGQYTASSSSMSKRGSRYLRNAVLRAASIIWYNDPHFNAYYQKKKLQGKHHNVIIGHIAHKLIRVIYHLLTTNSSFKTQLY